MPFLNRLWAILPSFGSPLQNDSQYLKNNNALAAASTTTVTLSGFTQTFSKGFVRVKVYDGNVAAATVTLINVVVSDGTQFVSVFFWSPVVATAPLLSIVPGGTVIGAANGSITGGLAVLTSASAPFTPAMVGLPIALSNAGTGGNVFFSTILSYQSASQVTLSSNAVTTSTTAVMTLTGQYGNAGILGTSVAGLDFLIPFEVDLNVSQVSVLTTLATASAVAVEDVEISGTT